MSKTVVIVGAGPMLGMSVARAFGARDYSVALISRRREALDAMVAELDDAGVSAAGFVADLRDADQLTEALAGARTKFGSIDVLEYSPLAMAFVPPSQVTAEIARDAFDFLVTGAITAVRAVLPEMQARGDGVLLFASGRSALLPMKLLGSLGLASAAQRHYVYSLNEELRDSGIFVGSVPILARMDRDAADAVAALFLEMVDQRDRVERVYGPGEAADAARAIAATTQVHAPFELPRAAA
jgi:NADP-dependent 3-hydroxy acid dehydrogenase YdfG